MASVKQNAGRYFNTENVYHNDLKTDLKNTKIQFVKVRLFFLITLETDGDTDLGQLHRISRHTLLFMSVVLLWSV